MNKIKDRIFLSILAGGIGTIFMMIVDLITSQSGLSQRSYRTTAAGVWVSSRRQADSWEGQLLGSIMALGLSMIGAFGLVSLLTKYGKDKIVLKGTFFGISFGAIIQALLSGLVKNKVSPKDALSNLWYVASNAVFGITTALAASTLGHDSLFDAEPRNNWLKPTEKTSEEIVANNPMAAR
ncbi:hypothetical protein [Desulfosporosinus lacus]|uniref:Uncharacterized protein n=1 Tax=Desulfosporosinus lacus DSM 15449 TaxID=1121420 RepID=A0A1M5XEY8_9FIRM|nr:hypothetical protein [Desulfosporosinus lacus]SHH98361.1 hypothetical protein SAMN02746098_01978 [Desulfosporosinus lacus DSM 15449]